MDALSDAVTPPKSASASLGWPIGSIFLGIVIIIVAYANRPPSNAGEALGMLLTGRQHFLAPPVYASFLVIGAAFAIYGIARTVSRVLSNHSGAGPATS